MIEKPKIAEKNFILNNGIKIPSMAYGTANMSIPCPKLKESIIEAV